jgi:enamine deaminase RidA (YjgF/YER057c/UK114 family)
MNARDIYRNGPLSVWFTSAGDEQMHVTAAVARPPADPARLCAEVYDCIAGALAERGMCVLHERIFGSLNARAAVLQARRKALAARGLEDDAPPTYVQGRPLWGEGLAGVELWAVRPGPSAALRTVRHEGVPCGRAWERGSGRLMVLQSVHGGRPGGGPQPPRAAQAEGMFDRANAILKAQGAAYGDVVQTWVYVSQILQWYDEFNGARNRRYKEFGLMGRELPAGVGPRLPASTGIMGDNPFGAACVMDVLTVSAGPEGGPDVAYLSNVEQSEAFAYGSAFSRGACIREADVTHVHVSGTAAIDQRGTSLFVQDPEAQMERTFEIVGALLAQEGATLHDVCEATVFLKRPEDAPAFERVAAEQGLSEMPAVRVQADVCRGELLFEMDGIAVLAPGRRPGG